jgi:hypothetical protein
MCRCDQILARKDARINESRFRLLWVGHWIGKLAHKERSRAVIGQWLQLGRCNIRLLRDRFAIFVVGIVVVYNDAFALGLGVFCGKLVQTQIFDDAL